MGKLAFFLWLGHLKNSCFFSGKPMLKSCFSWENSWENSRHFDWAMSCSLCSPLRVLGSLISVSKGHHDEEPRNQKHSWKNLHKRKDAKSYKPCSLALAYFKPKPTESLLKHTHTHFTTPLEVHLDTQACTHRHAIHATLLKIHLHTLHVTLLKIHLHLNTQLMLRFTWVSLFSRAQLRKETPGRRIRMKQTWD